MLCIVVRSEDVRFVATLFQFPCLRMMPIARDFFWQTAVGMLREVYESEHQVFVFKLVVFLLTTSEFGGQDNVLRFVRAGGATVVVPLVVLSLAKVSIIMPFHVVLLWSDESGFLIHVCFLKHAHISSCCHLFIRSAARTHMLSSAMPGIPRTSSLVVQSKR